ACPRAGPPPRGPAPPRALRRGPRCRPGWRRPPPPRPRPGALCGCGAAPRRRSPLRRTWGARPGSARRPTLEFEAVPAPAGRSSLSALPSPLARGLAFAAIILAGLAGGLIGWAFLRLQTDSTLAAAIGALVGAVGAAAGVAVVAVLVLRALG